MARPGRKKKINVEKIAKIFYMKLFTKVNEDGSSFFFAMCSLLNRFAE
jgi:hypothetical protein